MAATKGSTKKATARGTAKPDPAKVIGGAAHDLEREIAQTVRSELKNLHKMFLTIQRDAQKALDRVERALDVAQGKAKKSVGKKAAAKRPAAKKAAAKRPAAKKSPARKPAKKTAATR